MTQAQLRNSHAAGMADIPSVVFIFGKDLLCELQIEDFSDTEGIQNDRVGISRAVKVRVFLHSEISSASLHCCHLPGKLSIECL